MESELLICPIDAFCAHYMPFAPSDADVDNFISEHLKKPEAAHVLQFKQAEGGDAKLVFKAYPEAPTKTSGSNEEQQYGPLSEIASAISQFRSFNDRIQSTLYKHCLNDYTSSDIAGTSKTNKIDACFYMKNANEKFHISGIAVPIEQKLSTSDTSKHQNRLQLLSASVHVMNDDPRRMNTFGITIHSGEMTLWYNCRSHSTTSDSFNFVDDPRKLIKVFMAFLFATDEELGYDSTVKRNKDGTYTYKMPHPDGRDHFYRTEKNLSFYRSNNITGSMTRVWLVREVTAMNDVVKNGQQAYALKDVWLGEKADTENQILNSVFADIERVFQSTDQFQTPEMQTIYDQLAPMVTDGSYKKYFMTVIADYVGKVCPTIALEAIYSPGLLIKPVRSTSSVSTKRSSTVSPYHVPLLHAATLAPPSPRQFLPRKQYRVVYKEVCTDLDGLTTVGSIITALSQVHTALKLLFCAGWVHRDISCGNIMVEDGTRQVKLADLEYAKKFPRSADMPGAADPKTGTEPFIADEIVMGAYIYAHQVEGGKYYKKSDSDVPRVVIHNFQHDLESIFWIVLYIILFRAKNAKPHWWTDAVFGLRNPISRHSGFLNGVQGLEDAVDPALADILPYTQELRSALLGLYKQREASETTLNDASGYAPLMLIFDAFWSDVEESRAKWDMAELASRDLEPEVLTSED